MKNEFRIIIQLFVLGLFVGCLTDPNPCSLSQETLNDINRLDSLIKIPATIERERQWMRNNYNESTIFDADNEVYRLIVSTSFVGTELYKIEKVGSSYKGYKKWFKGTKDENPEIIKLNIEEEEWLRITKQLSLLGFWTYPITDSRAGLDGSTWQLEGFKPEKDECTGKNFHHISRWSPNDSIFLEMCNLFLELRENG